MSFETYSQNISARKVLKFALLPDFKSRFQQLGQNLSFFVMFFASFFNTAGLIPDNHPCLRFDNAGRYGFKDVIGIAYGNIKWQRAGIPQILMFFAVIVSLVMSVVLIFSTLFYYLVSYAHAQSIFSLDSSQPQENEYALQFLARVFGDTGIGAFDPNENSAGYSWLTVALQKMLAIYSETMMIIGGFIVLYYIVTVVVEAAQTGKPLGGRFSVWAPARLAIAIMMLVPVPTSGGYNGAQLIIFQSISWGSNLATNIWVTGLNAYKSQCDTSTMENCMVGFPQTSNNAEFIRGVFLITGCQAAYNAKVADGGVDSSQRVTLRVVPDYATKTTIHNYGTKVDQDYCGSYQLPWTAAEESGSWSTGETFSAGPPSFETISMNEGINAVKQGYMGAYASLFEGNWDVITVAEEIVSIINPGDSGNADELYTQDKLDRHVILSWSANYKAALDAKVKEAIEKQNTLADIVLPMGKTGGWANAGAFFMTLARLNGGVQSAVSNSPSIIKMPEILTNPQITPSGVDEDNKGIVTVHEMMKKMVKWWNDYPLNDNSASELNMYGYGRMQSASPDDATGQAGSIDANSVFNFFTGPLGHSLKVQDTLNPLGELMTLGGIITNTALLGVIFGAVFTNALGVPGLGYFIMTISGLFMAMGVALWIVLPLLPFFYFTFGVVNWVIAVFEAIVGAPLWALSFLKIDGAGLPAGGMNGIYLIFLLFIHPTLMIFGLIGSILAFSAAVSFLNTTFSLAMESIASGQPASGISGFFYIIMYVIIVYMLGQSCFKMIDTIPKKIVRFMKGNDTSTYGELGDAQGLQKHTLVAATVMTGLGSSAHGLADKNKLKKKDDDGDKNPSGLS